VTFELDTSDGAGGGGQVVDLIATSCFDVADWIAVLAGVLAPEIALGAGTRTALSVANVV